MNYLAHAYLSFNEPEILVGNMISDFVKGKKKFAYPAGIQKGIALHRDIDQFTDDHPATREAKLFFKPVYRLYSGAFIDVVYDHFLANDAAEFSSDASLEKFTHAVYNTLEQHLLLLPEVFQEFFPQMKKHNWLNNYRHVWGVERSFWGLVSRSAYLSDHVTAYAVFVKNYTDLKNCYRVFFPDLKQFAARRLSNLLGNASLYID